MKYIKIILISFLFSTIVNASALLPIEKSLITGKLENGFEYTIKKNEKPENRAFIRLLVKAGALEEDDDQKGVAHLVEHMAFNGTENFKGNDLIKFLESLGVSFGGHLNASTNYTETIYQLEIPLENDNLEKAMLIFSDWAGRISFSQEELDKERGVVQEEARARNDVRFRLFLQSKDILYKNSKYKDRTPIGDMDIIKNIKLDRVKAFYDDWYRPEFMHLVIVGDFDVKKVEELIKSNFKNFKNKSNKKLSSREVPSIDETRILILNDKELVKSNTSFSFYEKTSKLRTEKDYKDALIQAILIKIINLKAQEQVLKLNPDAKNIFLNINPLGTNLAGYNFIASYDENKGIQAFEELIKFIFSIDKFGFNENDFKNVIKELNAQNEKTLKSLDSKTSNEYVEEIIRTYADDEIFIDEIYRINLEKKLLNQITLEDIIQEYKTILNNKNRVITFASNKEEKISKELIDKTITKALENLIKEEEVKSLPKKISLEENLKPIKIVKESFNKEYDFYEFTLENGIKVIYKYNDYKKNIVSLHSFSKGGFSVYNNFEDFINAKYAINVVGKSGYDIYNILEVQKIYMDKDIKLNLNIGRYYDVINANSSTKDFETLIENIYLLANKYNFDENIFQNTKVSLINDLKKEDLNPSRKFQKELISFRYLNDKRFNELEEKDVELLTKDKILNVYKDRFSDFNNFIFIIVGDISKDEVKKQIEKYFGNLPISTRIENYNFNETKPLKGKQKFIKNYNNENISQVSFSFNIEKPYSLEDSVKLSALSDILSTKLREQIREEKSGVYGVSVRGNFIREPYENANINISFTCDPGRKDELVKEVKSVIENLKIKPIEQKYIDSFIKKREVSFYEEKKEIRFWINQLKNSYLYDESLDNIEKYIQLVNSINAKDLLETANIYLNTEDVLYTELNPKEK